jgi:hypothetical protein
MLMIFYDTSSIKAFTDDKNTVNVEYFINKAHTYNISIWLKQHTLSLKY